MHPVGMTPARRGVTFLLVLVAIALAARPAGAAPFDNRPKFLIHVTPTTLNNKCAFGQISDCSNANTSGQLVAGSNHFAYLLVARGNLASVSGLQCGIMYQDNCPNNNLDQAGLDIFSWTLCATLEFITPGPQEWPRPSGGNLITWDSTNNCQTGPVAVAGYFYVGAYGPDRLQIIRRPADGLAKVANCLNQESLLVNRELGRAEFSAGALVAGCNPCNQDCPDPVIPRPTNCPGPPPPPPPPPPGPGTGTAKIMLHVKSTTTKNACAFGTLADCSGAVVKGGITTPGGPYQFVYVLATHGSESGLQGIQFGIGYENNNPGDIDNLSRIDVFGWTLCATLEFSSPLPNPWPTPGSGNLITWNTCQVAHTAVAGYFYIAAYSNDVMRVTRRPVDNVAKTANCVSAESIVSDSNLGSAAFSPGAATNGCNPCLVDCTSPTPVEETTWSGVKTLFEN